MACFCRGEGDAPGEAQVGGGVPGGDAGEDPAGVRGGEVGALGVAGGGDDGGCVAQDRTTDGVSDSGGVESARPAVSRALVDEPVAVRSARHGLFAGAAEQKFGWQNNP
ncbi:hypothetical protein [Micromonospora sp. NPDC005197]|uniref:hypothetical protein n=1 Tax=Micromonospora sp. NPDC005197 TaxID=3157020 RepID=UPI0033AFC4DD